jgi:dihydroorotate dehydrogenase
MMLRGALNPDYFNSSVRPMLYKLCRGDPELVHDFMLNMLDKHGQSIRALSKYFFKPPENLRINFRGVSMLPFGTAAGMDKNCDALLAFENIFGFQEPGTIILPVREGNKRVRVAVLDDEKDLLNAQGFPSKGISHSVQNLNSYRQLGGKSQIFASICGLPISGDNIIETSMEEMKTLMAVLKHDVNGFVWNPFSPNTDALKVLREPTTFRETSLLMAKMAPDHLRLVKLGPYSTTEERIKAMALVASFLEGGGHGVVTTNTRMITKDKLPPWIQQNWGYPSAGRSGRYLQDYRLRSIRDIRSNFPEAIIVGTGGIYTAIDAYASFQAGANLLEGYTPYTFFGAGLLREITQRLSQKLKRQGITLSQLQKLASPKVRLE